MLKKSRHCPVKGSRGVDSKAVKLARELFESLDTPFSLGLSIALSSGDYETLVSARVDPHGYTDAETFSQDYLAAEAFSKYPDWNTGVDREAVAIAKFLESESVCLETNRRLRRPLPPDLQSPVGVASVLFTARRKIEALLGDFCWSQAERFFDFGPGACFALPRRKSHAFYKFSGIPETTRECAVAADALIKSVPGWTFHLACLTESQSGNDSLVNIVPGNRITTVPKNAKTDRVIAIEPLVNGMLQKGIGGVIRNRLRRVGVNLNDQVPNQDLAREGSILGNFATIDLKSASDCVSTGIVRELLPPTWVSAIELCRSTRGVLPNGSMIYYQKVSSMGNGFTFELESLIFWALCSSVIDLSGARERRMRVYGDDLIVSSEVAEDVISVLSFAGFETNEKKTFITGPFRESCGKHFFRGVDVTPFYLREKITVAQLLLYANNVRRWSRHPVWGMRPVLYTAYQGAVSLLPEKLRKPRIPDGFGDSALIGDFDEALPRRAGRGLEGWRVTVRLPISNSLKVDGIPYLLASLLRKEVPRVRPVVKGSDEWLQMLRVDGGRSVLGSIPDGEVFQNCEILVPQWDNFGPWLTTKAA